MEILRRIPKGDKSFIFSFMGYVEKNANISWIFFFSFPRCSATILIQSFLQSEILICPIPESRGISQKMCVGGVLEWTNRPVLKTGVVKATVGSNPTPSASGLTNRINLIFIQRLVVHH